ncbi:hypothetical protein RHOSPDRAFT_30798 [Rhodotorula sp. JG-1b]|nr:hypothetical protein RHOSPDRAFT_30798 [Rhodotorula sp. JG-1b]
MLITDSFFSLLALQSRLPCSSKMPAYDYPEGNRLLIDTLNLQRAVIAHPNAIKATCISSHTVLRYATAHPEAGFFCETARTEETVPSPFAGDATRNMATQIYYLLTPDSPQGKMHMNKSITYHLLHQGRAKYTLIRPASTPSSSPEIKHVVMGADTSRGEVRQLVVEGGWWKASEIPEEDLDDEEADGNKIGSSSPRTGFDFADHKFLDREGLVELFGGDESHPAVEQLLPYTQER